MRIHGFGAIVGGLLLSACGALHQPTKPAPADASPSPVPAAGTPDIALNTALPGASQADSMIPGVAPGGSAEAANPAYDLSSVESAQTWHPQLNNWRRSAEDAIKEARLGNKLLLILFAHTHLELSQQLEATLLISPEFRKTVEKDFVLLRLDYSDSDTARSAYYQGMKTRLKVRGFPTLIATLPNGHEVLRCTGYQPEWKSRYLTNIKTCIENSVKMKEHRRKQMQATGYRLWKDKNGAEVFAKLNQVDANQLTLTSEWGDEFHTFSTRLSEADQAWIEKQRPPS